MQEGKAKAVADGGSKQQIGTFGVVVDWGDEENQMTTRGPVDVSHNAHNSLQPEMHGAWAGLELTDMLTRLRPMSARL
jgi:hypothetical protein